MTQNSASNISSENPSTNSSSIPPLEFRSECLLGRSLEIFGDKWTLLIIRDIAYGKATFSELEASEEKITTNILTNRLKRLVEFEIISKELYQEKPKRYKYLLTPKGLSLLPVLREIVNWAENNMQSICNTSSSECQP